MLSLFWHFFDESIDRHDRCVSRLQGVPEKTAPSLMHSNFTTVSQSHAVFTEMFRNYLITQERAKFEECCQTFLV